MPRGEKRLRRQRQNAGMQAGDWGRKTAGQEEGPEVGSRGPV